MVEILSLPFVLALKSSVSPFQKSSLLDVSSWTHLTCPTSRQSFCHRRSRYGTSTIRHPEVCHISKFCQSSMAPTGFPILFQPSFHGMDLLDASSSLFSLGCCFEREKTGTSSSLILRHINLLSLSQPFTAWDHLHPKPTKVLTHNSPYINQNQQVSQSKTKTKSIHPHSLSLSKVDKQMTCQDKMSPKMHLQAL